jgi:hypothetical protein
MATPITRVEDAEELIRRVAANSTGYAYETGQLVISASAFNDPHEQPSVDRRTMRTSIGDCKTLSTDGLAKLYAHEVRGVLLPQKDPNGNVIGSYRVDAIHRPVEASNAGGLPPNPAHSQIESTPHPTRSRFKVLKEALARIATKHGWMVAPS